MTELGDRGTQWVTGGSAMIPCKAYTDLRSPAQVLHRVTHRQIQREAEVDPGVRKLSEGAENFVSSVFRFFCQCIPWKIHLLKNNSKTLMCCTIFPSLGFFGDNCPKIIVLM